MQYFEYTCGQKQRGLFVGWLVLWIVVCGESKRQNSEEAGCVVTCVDLDVKVIININVSNALY